MIHQHLVQKTYTRLTLLYASLCHDLIYESPKSISQDLTIVAFLIELWRSLYGVNPAVEGEQLQGTSSKEIEFPRFNFVDIGCGNGVVVYVLLMEGYHGFGMDARHLETWDLYPQWVQDRLRKAIYVPKPFADAISDADATTDGTSLDLGVEVVTCTSMFSTNTFIISNHADELTLWTPLMATFANPALPLPFLAIPCCSYSLTGAMYWHPPPSKEPPLPVSPGDDAKRDCALEQNPVQNKDQNVHQLVTRKQAEENEMEEFERNPQPASGDLKALRASKMAAISAQNDLGSDASTTSRYGCLTAKTVRISQELGYSIHTSQVQLPSLRNSVIVGVRQQPLFNPSSYSGQGSPADEESPRLFGTALAIVRRECAREGGIKEGAKIWIERAKKVHIDNY